jgi:hypothetical protein
MKRIAGIVLFLLTAYSSFSCDYCNCYLGLNPHYKKNTIGIRYHYMNYTGTHESQDELSDMGLSKSDFWETRMRAELHGQWYATQKLKLIFSAPYVINMEGTNGEPMEHSHSGTSEENHHGTETIHGIGDPLILANYQLFNTTGDSMQFSQRLFAGGGIKFPLGKWKLEDDAEAHERVHQPGTGSWDFILNAEYLVKRNKTGINVQASYMLTTSNTQYYQFANRFNANLVCYYQVNLKKTSMYPSIGTYFEQAGKDSDHHMAVDNSGGTILFAHAGVDFYFNKFSISTAFQLPALQQLNDPQPEMKYRCIAGITYAFN